MMVRAAVLEDAPAILRIYSPAVLETASSFELECPTVDEMKRRISNTQAQYPWLVFERDGEVLGYAYATAYRPRLAYQWSAEVSVYVAADARRLGIARTLYSKLLSILKDQGYFNAFAVITLPNPASVSLHQSLGFTPVGVLHSVGYKLGRWHDVGLWQLEIQPHRNPSSPPAPFSGRVQ